MTQIPNATIPFQFMGAAHVTVIVLTAAIPLVLAWWAKKARSSLPARAICWSLAALLVINEVSYLVYGLATVDIRLFLRDYLPLHVCGVGVFLTAFVLLRPNQLAYEIAYFWGLAGTFQAILTPTLPEGFPEYHFFQYFIAHGGIVTGVLFVTLGLRMRPMPGSITRTFLLTNAFLVIVGGLDALLGANYMFLCEPPAGESPFFFAPWPWYIAFLEVLGLGLVGLLYLPFYASDYLRRRRGESSLKAQAKG